MSRNLSEKAGAASTSLRILAESLKRGLERDYPHLAKCPGWSQFVMAATVGGCFALALRLHSEVAEDQRTPLEEKLRHSLKQRFKESEQAYAACHVFVTGSLIGIPRPERGSAVFVLIAIWVLGIVTHGETVEGEEYIAAILAELYQAETSGFWRETPLASQSDAAEATEPRRIRESRLPVEPAFDRTEPRSGTLPTSDDLKKLPLRAIVAYAVRCARRVQPMFRLANAMPDFLKQDWAVERAISVAERFCLDNDLSCDSQTDSARVATAAVTAANAAEYAAYALGYAAHAPGRVNAFAAAKAAHAARAAAQAAAYAGSNEFKARASDAANALAEVVRKADNIDAGTAAAAFVAASSDASTSAVGAATAARNAARADFDRLRDLYPRGCGEVGKPIDPAEDGPLGLLCGTDLDDLIVRVVFNTASQEARHERPDDAAESSGREATPTQDREPRTIPRDSDDDGPTPETTPVCERNDVRIPVWKQMLRWLAILPGTFLASIIAFCVGQFSTAMMGRAWSGIEFVDRWVLAFASEGLSCLLAGAVLVLTAAWIAPRGKKPVAIIFAGAFLFLSSPVILLAIANERWPGLFGLVLFNVGTIRAAAAVWNIWPTELPGETVPGREQELAVPSRPKSRVKPVASGVGLLGKGIGLLGKMVAFCIVGVIILALVVNNLVRVAQGPNLPDRGIVEELVLNYLSR